MKQTPSSLLKDSQVSEGYLPCRVGCLSLHRVCRLPLMHLDPDACLDAASVSLARDLHRLSVVLRVGEIAGGPPVKPCGRGPGYAWIATAPTVTARKFNPIKMGPASGAFELFRELTVQTGWRRAPRVIR